MAADTRDTHEVLHAVRAIGGVIEVEALELVHVHVFRSHFVRVPSTATRARGNLDTVRSTASTRSRWLSRRSLTGGRRES